MPSYKSIEDANYDEAVVVNTVDEKVQGQSQTTREPDDGKVTVNEVSIATDQVIVDPHHPLAVQVPEEGIGSAVLSSALSEGKSALDVFGSGGDADKAEKSEPKTPSTSKTKTETATK